MWFVGWISLLQSFPVRFCTSIVCAGYQFILALGFVLVTLSFTKDLRGLIVAPHCHRAQRKSTCSDGNSLYTSGNKYTCNTYTTGNPVRATAAKRFFCVCPASQPQQLAAALVSKPSQEHCVWSIDNTHPFHNRHYTAPTIYCFPEDNARTAHIHNVFIYFH